jgi:hypothetical protein
MISIIQKGGIVHNILRDHLYNKLVEIFMIVPVFISVFCLPRSMVFGRAVEPGTV